MASDVSNVDNWTDWSPDTVTCGNGTQTRVRTRKYRGYTAGCLVNQLCRRNACIVRK